MTTVNVNPDGSITIPAEVCTEVGLVAGDRAEVTASRTALLISPVDRLKDAAEFDAVLQAVLIKHKGALERLADL